jgi:hypothetical protein
VTRPQARHAARTIAGRDALAGVTRDRDDFLRELRALAVKMGWPVIQRRTNARAYGHYLAFREEFKPRSAGDFIVACMDCTLPVALVEGDAGYEGNGQATREDGAWAHNACINARCTDCGERAGVNCAPHNACINARCTDCGERAGVNCAHRRTEALSA